MKRIRSRWIGVVTAGILALLGCQTSKEAEKAPKKAAAHSPEMSPAGSVALPKTVATFDDNHVVAEPLKFKNLTVWALLAKKIAELGEFLTLKEAQAHGVAVVRETGADRSSSPGQAEAAASAENRNAAPQGQAIGHLGTVNSLVVENKGDLPILVCAGTVVKGGNQDRQIGQDFVIAPKTSVPVEAFCIEAHRWTAVRDGNQTFGLFECKDVVTALPVRYSAQYAADQSSVWHNVAHLNAVAAKAPSTDTFLATIEETEKEALALRDEIRKAVSAYFQDLRDKGLAPVGFAYAVNGKPVSVRTFAHPRLFEGQLDFFLNAMCMEADLAQREAKAKGKDSTSSPASVKDLLEMVQRINQVDEKVSPTSAANRNGVRKCSAGGNSNCYVGKDSTPITRDWTMAAE